MSTQSINIQLEGGGGGGGGEHSKYGHTTGGGGGEHSKYGHTTGGGVALSIDQD